MALLPLSLTVLLLAGRPVRAQQDIWVHAPTATEQALLRRSDLGFAEGSAGGWLRMHADPSGLQALDAGGLVWRAVAPPPPGLPAAYLSPSEMQQRLADLVASAPELVSPVHIGRSRSGLPIEGVRISSAASPAASWRILGAHHGDELPSGEVALAFAEHLVRQHGVDEELTGLLSRDAIWVFPHINPDGVAQASRYNAAGVDLNRNYGYQWNEAAYRPGDAPFSEPESRAVRGLSAWNPFMAGLSLHAGASNLGWVWNHTTTASPDASLVQTMAEAYAHTCTAPAFWITTGGAWYVTYGDTHDWSYGTRGVLDFTLEVSADKAPDHSEVAGIIEDHMAAMRRFLLWPHRLSAAVVDAETGRGVPATVTLVDSGQPVPTDMFGQLTRLMPQPGAWAVDVDAPGYTARRTTLTVGAAQQSIPLQPASLGPVLETPIILSQGQDGRFSLAANTVSLHRPGEDDILPTWQDGAWVVRFQGVTPGAWDITADGVTMPRAVFIGEPDDTVVVLEAEATADTLMVYGEGFHPGLDVIGLWGPERAPIRLPVLWHDETTIAIDSSGLDALQEGVDVVIWSLGAQVAVQDALGKSLVDADPPEVEEWTPDDEDTAEADRPLTDRTAGCASAASPASPAVLLIAAVGLGLAGSRRRTR
jgi:hypothetical protein